MNSVYNKVLLVAQPLPPQKSTGIARYTYELLGHLQQEIDAKLVSFRYFPLSEQFTSLRSFPIGIEDSSGQEVRHLTQIYGASIQAYRPYKRMMATVHDLGPLLLAAERQDLNRIDWELLKVQFRGLKKMTYLVADSEFTRQTVIDILDYPPDRIFKVYIGLNSKFFQKTSDGNLEIDQQYQLTKLPDTFDLLYVGNEKPRKNIAILLETVHELKKRGYKVRLLKVGRDNQYRHHTISIIEKYDIRQDVQFIDFVSDEDLLSLYNFADAFITTSLMEGFGLPIAEAMAVGIPVVCSDQGSLPEIAGDAAIICPVEDSSAFADGVAKIIEDSTLRDMLIEKGKLQVSKFTWKNTIQNLLPIYQKLSQE